MQSPQIFGSYIEPDHWQEAVRLRFSPRVLTHKNRWYTNTITADFFADYSANLFSDTTTAVGQAEIRDAVNYVTNELLENALKYSYRPFEYDVEISLYLYNKHLGFYLRNKIHNQAVATFQNLIKRLLDGDAHQLQMHQIRRRAAGKTGESNLGFLTMLTGYQAQLAWKFEGPESDVMTVTTMVELTIPDLMQPKEQETLFNGEY